MIAAGPVSALELQTPVNCPAGVSCYIQSLVDRDAGPGVSDFACGQMSYDGHKGVDFRVATLKEMQAGVPVLAAASGRVRATRDGEPDTGKEHFTKGKDCGNAVLLEHEDGWTTQYCHMARGSVAVRPGDMVQAGDQLGLIGFSGRTEFPHLHLTVRRNGVVVDPFDGRIAREACAISREEDTALWASPAPELRFGGLVDMGFTGVPPTIEAVRAGLPEQGFTARNELLVFWMRAFGLRADDVVMVRLTGPDGDRLATTTNEIDRPRAEEFRFVGKRRPASGWPEGEYLGVVGIMRDGEMLDAREISVMVR